MPQHLYRSPPVPQLARKTYIGIDPGAGGGIAAITGDLVALHKFGGGDSADWDFIARYVGSECAAAIELQTPRPTFLPQKAGREARSTILASTCLLFGHYRALQAMLTCACIPTYTVPPKRWQAAHGIKKAKGESTTAWKNRLKSKAEALRPATKLTLATSDALLIAEYLRMMDEGELP